MQADETIDKWTALLLVASVSFHKPYTMKQGQMKAAGAAVRGPGPGEQTQGRPHDGVHF